MLFFAINSYSLHSILAASPVLDPVLLYIVPPAPPFHRPCPTWEFLIPNSWSKVSHLHSSLANDEHALYMLLLCAKLYSITHKFCLPVFFLLFFFYII